MSSPTSSQSSSTSSSSAELRSGSVRMCPMGSKVGRDRVAWGCRLGIRRGIPRLERCTQLGPRTRGRQTTNRIARSPNPGFSETGRRGSPGSSPWSLARCSASSSGRSCPSGSAAVATVAPGWSGRTTAPSLALSALLWPSCRKDDPSAHGSVARPSSPVRRSGRATVRRESTSTSTHPKRWKRLALGSGGC